MKLAPADAVISVSHAKGCHKTANGGNPHGQGCVSLGIAEHQLASPPTPILVGPKKYRQDSARRTRRARAMQYGGPKVQS